MKDVDTFTETDTPGLTNAWDFLDNPNDDVANNDYWGIQAGFNGGYPYLTELQTPPVGHLGGRRFSLCRHITSRLIGAEGIQVI